MSSPVPAVVLGCHKIGLGIIRSLGVMGVPVIGVSYNPMDMGIASKYLVGRYRGPHPDRDPDGFLRLLSGLGRLWSGSVLIPSDDATLVAVSRHRDVLNNDFKLAAGEWPVVEKCIVKKHTYALAERIGVPCPRTLVPSSEAEAEDFAARIGFPCLIKPTVSHSFFERFRRKMLFIEDRESLVSALALTFGRGIEIMLQEYIPGDDACGTNYNSFFLDGKPLVEVTARKVRLSPPRVGFPRVVISLRIPELLPLGRRVLQALGYSGFSCMEFKKDARDGVYRLMEINARLNLSAPLSAKAGVNFPYLLYRHTLTGQAPEARDGFRQGIYWIDLGKDLLESVRSFRQERFPPLEYIRPYANPHVFDTLSARDMGPALKRLRDAFAEGPRRLFTPRNKRSAE